MSFRDIEYLIQGERLDPLHMRIFCRTSGHFTSICGSRVKCTWNSNFQFTCIHWISCSRHSESKWGESDVFVSNGGIENKGPSSTDLSKTIPRNTRHRIFSLTVIGWRAYGGGSRQIIQHKNMRVYPPVCYFPSVFHSDFHWKYRGVNGWATNDLTMTTRLYWSRLEMN